MSHFCKVYVDHVCNRYLDLDLCKLSQKEFDEIVYCLTHQDEIPFGVKVRTASFVNTTVKDKIITKDMFPIELFNSNIQLIMGN